VYAALERLTVDPEQAPAAAEALVSDILPRVRSAAGFVAGYWLEPAEGQGHLFESAGAVEDRRLRRTVGSPFRSAVSLTTGLYRYPSSSPLTAS
jgi:hypothetical protein